MLSIRTNLRRWAEARRLRRITLDDARRRAARGAAYLDDADPGWHERLDPDHLTLADGTCCVLGQLHGDFRLGLGRSSILHLSSAPRASLSPVDLGFLCVQGVSDAWQAHDYGLLDRAWREEIARRRPAAMPPGGSDTLRTGAHKKPEPAPLA